MAGALQSLHQPSCGKRNLVVAGLGEGKLVGKEVREGICLLVWV